MSSSSKTNLLIPNILSFNISMVSFTLIFEVIAYAIMTNIP